MDTLELFNKIVNALEDSTLAKNPDELNRLVGLIDKRIEEIDNERNPKSLGIK